MTPVQVLVVGAGNVAWHMVQLLASDESMNCYVYNRSKIDWPDSKPWQWVATVEETPADIDLCLLCVSDGALLDVLSTLLPFLPSHTLVVHCSGATPLALLSDKWSRSGVFYPLQTLTKGVVLRASKIPLCIEAVHETDATWLEYLAQRLGNPVYRVNTNQRAHLHVAAVFVNNFVNYLYSIGGGILQEQEMPVALLVPLMEETLRKHSLLGGNKAQTGPALRGDTNTMDRHLAMLDSHPAWQEIYRLLSDRIRNYPPK